MTSRARAPDLGVGLGLRVPHYGHVLGARPDVDFFEIISENFMVDGGRPLANLDRVLERYRVVQHGVSLSIAGPEAPGRDYLTRLKALVRRTRAPWVSDHFCWCGAGATHLHDLLPIPYTREAVDRVVERARQVQDFLEVPFALENTSSYVTYQASTYSEWDFVAEICERADIGLLFDVNNVYVSSYNHDLDPREFVRRVPHERIFQIHMAGHTNLGPYIIDTHDGPAIDPVLDLYEETIELTGAVSTLVEWDDHIPEFPVLAAEAERIRAVRERALRARAQRVAQGLPAGAAPRREPITFQRGAPQGGAGWTQGGPREAAAE